MRLLIISGQGTTAQTAAALATACHAARSGLRVLIASIGPTHRLGALLERTLGPRPHELEPNLAAMEISALDEIGQRWDSVRPGFRSGLAGRLRDIGSDELPSFPGMDEFSGLLTVTRAASTKLFDLVVFDGPSVENLLRSLGLPDTLRWVVRLIFGLDRGPGRSRSSQEAALVPMTIVPASTAAPLQDMRVMMEQQRSLLEAHNGARVRMVVSAEELALPPVRQALSGFGLYGLEVDTILVRGVEDDVDTATRQLFDGAGNKGRPKLLVDALPILPTDIASWAERGAALYDKRPEGLDIPLEAPGTPNEGGREIRLHIPFLDANSLDIAVASEEVVIRLGQFRRHLVLPGLTSGGRLRARIEGEILRLWIE